jgi:hypothetical protein
MTKDYLGRPLELDDFVIYMRQGYRQLHLARVVKFTATGKARIKYADHEWAQLLQEGDQLVKVEGPDLTYFLLNQKG